MDWLEKRRVGRPRTGKSPSLNVRVSAKLLRRIDASAADHFERRPYAVRRILIAGLRAEAGLKALP